MRVKRLFKSVCAELSNGIISDEKKKINKEKDTIQRIIRKNNSLEDYI